MPGASPIVYENATIVNTSVVNAAETVVGQVVVSNSSPQDVYIDGTLNLTLGATTSGLTLRIRRDSVTGTVVGVAFIDNIAVGTAAARTVSISVVDPQRECAGQVYVLTVVQTAATGSGLANNVAIRALTR